MGHGGQLCRIVAVLVALLTVGGLSAAVAAEAPGLVAYWPLDTVTGQITPDLSGNEANLIVGLAQKVKGVSNTGLKFDGKTAQARCMSAGSIDPATGLTIEAWVNLDGLDFSGFPSVVRKDGAYALRFSQSRIGMVLWFDGNPTSIGGKKTDWVTGRWYHLAATYDGATLRTYVDGQQDDALERPTDKPLDVSTAGAFVGSSPGQHSLKGTVDEVRLYNRALSPEEVAASYRRGLASLEAQKDLVFEPEVIGKAPAPFRKPPREVTMVQDGFLWIDAEDFADYGGWMIDTQFVHLMGSAYLISTGVGKPVDNATTRVRISQAGTYRLWVRAKNWLKDYYPGQFRVMVNGKPTAGVFGTAPTEDWIWESGGDWQLPQGETELALIDLTGYYGRCDALILTRDLNYTPPSEVEAIAKERSRLTGLSLEPTQVADYDVVVVGAGTAGCCAAIAAARHGAKTVLVQDRPVLGGNSSLELGVGVNGAGSSHPNARESGVMEEVGRVQAFYGYRKTSEPFAEVMATEPNLTVTYNKRVVAAEMQSKQVIASVKAVDTLTGAMTVYRGKYFIDCTGDGWVGYYAGAEYRYGREAKSEFNESLAPDQPDEITMSGCIMGQFAISYRAEDTGKPAPYTPPAWAPKFPSPEEFSRSPRGFAGGQWWLEHRGDINDLWDAEKARDELIRISYGYWDYIKNTWPERDKATNYAMTWVPYMDARRETRRLVGDYLLTQNDVQSARSFPDRIAHGGWPLDVHHPEGIYSGRAGAFWCDPPLPVYSIPYRILYSRNIDNLLMAGRHVSVTHLALGTVRVQGTLAALGQAAGTAAGMAKQYSTTPRGIYERYLPQLQQTLLKDDQYIPDLKNEDPLDLARTARVTASSVGDYEEFDAKLVLPAEMHELNMPRGVMFPRGQSTQLNSVFVLLSSALDEPATLTLHLREAADSGDFSSTKDIATATASVPAGRQSWVEFRVKAQSNSPYLYVWLPETPGLSWRLMEKAPYGSCRGYGGGPWTVVKSQFYAFYTEPAIRLALPDAYRPEYVISGVSRIVDRSMNAWASDPGQAMPQWIELQFPKQTTLNSVYLTFDTDLNAPYHSVPTVPQCVRDYDVSYWNGAQWVTLAGVKGNFQRRRIHRFEPISTDRLRLTVRATNGDKAARVFEIRAYNE